MEKENILRTFWDYIFEYFALRNVRKVFFFCIVAVLLFAIIYRIFEIDIFLKLFLVSCILATLTSLVDTLQDKAEFTEEINKLRKNQALRLAKIYGQDQPSKGKVINDDSFEENEKHYIKQKRRQYNYSITVKLIFLAFFLVLLF